MKVFITGGAGFIAKNLTEQLQNDDEIFDCDVEKLDLLDDQKVLSYLKKNKFDVVIHTATYDVITRRSTKDPAKVLENNLRMYFNLIRGQDYYGRLLYFGSGAEYGREKWQAKMREDYYDQNVPTDQYGYSKYLMTKYALLHKDIINLRLFAVFGKYEEWRARFISNACCRAVLNLPIEIKQNVFFDYLYIDDLVKIVKWFIHNKPAKKVYNICTGQANDLKTLAEMVRQISGKRLDIIIKTEGLGREYSGDNSLLMRELKNLELSPLEGSIKKLYDWYADNKVMIKDYFQKKCLAP
ncbi:MAG: NAD(P)-dependent oxidoreductase [bacterium]